MPSAECDQPLLDQVTADESDTPGQDRDQTPLPNRDDPDQTPDCEMCLPRAAIERYRMTQESHNDQAYERMQQLHEFQESVHDRE